MMNKFGKFASWEIISENLAIKYCDKSVFLHHGSGVPIETRWFWNAENLEYPDRIDIVLRYKDIDYKAFIAKERYGRTRIFWHQDLSNVFNQISTTDSYPIMFVEKKLGYYLISFHNFDLDSIESDNMELESTVVKSCKEGKKIEYYTTKYERNALNRKKAICLHGTRCMACGFDFEEVYGELGKDFIEVHHVVPLSDRNEEVEINPVTDLVCLCANCHRMIHRHRDSIMTLKELRDIIKAKS